MSRAKARIAGGLRTRLLSIYDQCQLIRLHQYHQFTNYPAHASSFHSRGCWWHGSRPGVPALGASNAISQTQSQVRRGGGRGGEPLAGQARSGSGEVHIHMFNGHAAPVPPSISKLDFMPAVCTRVEPLSGRRGRKVAAEQHQLMHARKECSKGWHTHAANMQPCLHVQALRGIGLQHEGRVQVRQQPLQLRQHLHSGRRIHCC